MFPIALDLTRLPVLLAGSGELLVKRLAYLDEAKAAHVAVFCERPTPALRNAAGKRLIERLPGEGDLMTVKVILVVALERPVAERIVGWAHAAGKLVNVEDVNDLCDFYFTANVRRGDLVISVSTSGASPTLARKVRDAIADRFGKEWSGYVAEVGALRNLWKSTGASMQELIDRTEHFLDVKGWLSEKKARTEEKVE